ncbi:MAG: histidinol-phosphate transaminase [Tractidigestivibacter sp.]|uniref:histidinol-phosphate transaminase n=1 Tax=Tractidigestivibacter sp. TaxID=2847320 RepID=UPI003D8C3B76
MAIQIDDDIRAQMRPSAAALEPYDPKFSPVEVNLSANENSFGMPDELRQAVTQAVSEVAFNRYPQALAPELRAELASWHGVDADHVIVGNGGDELLFNLFLAFGGRGHVLVNCPPAFSVYELYASLVETGVANVSRDPVSFVPDVDAMVQDASRASLVVVTSPNNPTGDLFPRDAVPRLCEACPGVVLVDEAYIEFADPGSTVEDLLGSYKNLAILHTFSKAFALASARVGYVLADPSVIGALSAVRQPYSVNSLSQAAALAVLRRRDKMAPIVQQIRRGREELFSQLKTLAPLGVTVWPSQSNFLLVRVPNAHHVWERLRDEHSILVRDFSSAPGLSDCLRITVGTPEENERVVKALQELLGKE